VEVYVVFDCLIHYFQGRNHEYFFAAVRALDATSFGEVFVGFCDDFFVEALELVTVVDWFGRCCSSIG